MLKHRIGIGIGPVSRPDNPRVASARVHPLLIARWSPSSFNGQPWLFLRDRQPRPAGLRLDPDAAQPAMGDHHTVICAFAAGRPGLRDALPDELRERERPSDRKSLAEIAHKGTLDGSAGSL